MVKGRVGVGARDGFAVAVGDGSWGRGSGRKLALGWEKQQKIFKIEKKILHTTSTLSDALFVLRTMFFLTINSYVRARVRVRERIRVRGCSTK